MGELEDFLKQPTYRKHSVQVTVDAELAQNIVRTAPARIPVKTAVQRGLHVANTVMDYWGYAVNIPPHAQLTIDVDNSRDQYTLTVRWFTMEEE